MTSNKIEEAREIIKWIKDTLDGAENVEPDELEAIFKQVLFVARKAARVECWLLVKDGQPLDSSFGGIVSIDGCDDGLFESIYEQEIWVSMHDCTIENADKFAPGIYRANFVASDFVHQEEDYGSGYWEHTIEWIGFKRVGSSTGETNV